MPNEINTAISGYIDKIYRATEDLKKEHRKYFDGDVLIAYRGEASDYGKTKLMPSIFRDNKYLSKEMHLFELLCDYNMISSSASNIEKAIEAQHYLAISRMLDISFNALSALYFACKSNENSNGYIFIFAFPEQYSPHSKYIQEFYTTMLDSNYIPYSRNFKVFSHSYSNERIKAQKGGFIFFPGSDFFPINECYYRRIEIDKIHKEKLIDELDLLFQINEAAIFPEKDKIAEVVKKKFIENQYNNKALNLDEEIKTYFDRLKYELTLCNKCKREIQRILRKEEHDLLMYVSKNKANEKVSKISDSIEVEIKSNFSIYRAMYKEI